MKVLRQLSLSLLLILALITSAMAAEIPEQFVVENLNGQQRIVKTYTLPPSTDPDTLVEAEFDYDGFRYAWSYTLKEEHPYLETREMTETVTVETAKNDLSQILDQLAPSIPYNDGEYIGELNLDHTSLATQAAGYTTRYSTTTETKVISNLDRNDMSYVPATIIKNGKTLSLANVEWQITGTALVGEALVPAQYQAIATYSASSSYKSATGYVTTAEYKGTVSSSGIESITYTVVYVGNEILPAEASSSSITSPSLLFYLLGGLFLLMIAGLAVLLWLHRKNVYIYKPGEPNDYEVIGKLRLTAPFSSIPITSIDPCPTGHVAIELKRTIAKKLVGREIKVLCPGGVYTYKVQQDRPGDWHEFNIDTLQEVTSTT